jgi:hypothetical protein
MWIVSRGFLHGAGVTIRLVRVGSLSYRQCFMHPFIIAKTLIGADLGGICTVTKTIT